MSDIVDVKVAVNSVYPFEMDDSMSLYEFIGKLVERFNQFADILDHEVQKSVTEQVTRELGEFTEDKINEFINSGQIVDMINQSIMDKIQELDVVTPEELDILVARLDSSDVQLVEIEQRFENIEQQLEDGTAGIDDNVISESKVWSSSKTQQEIGNLINIASTIYTSDTQPPNPSEGDIWFKIVASTPELPVTDYFFRFDASELQLDDGANVTQWADMSANGHDITQDTANLQPVYLAEGFNGKPTVKFDGSILSKTPFNLDSVNGATIFLVAQVDVGGSSSSIVTVGQTTTNVKAIGLRYSGSGAMIATYIHAPSVALSSASTSLNTPYLLTTTFDMVETKMYKNGAYQTKAPYTEPIGDHTILAIGSSPYTTIPEPFTGRISELIYFSRGLSEQEITELNSYLMQKWGI